MPILIEMQNLADFEKFIRRKVTYPGKYTYFGTDTNHLNVVINCYPNNICPEFDMNKTEN